MTAYIIRKNAEDYCDQNTDIYEYGNTDYSLENDDLLYAICEVAIDDINLVSRAEYGTGFINNNEYAFGYADVDKIDEIVNRCINRAVEKLTIAECEALIAEAGIYRAFEIAREWSCDFMDLSKDKDWRRVIYSLIQSQLSFTNWIIDVSVEVFDAIDGEKETDEADETEDQNLL